MESQHEKQQNLTGYLPKNNHQNKHQSSHILNPRDHPFFHTQNKITNNPFIHHYEQETKHNKNQQIQKPLYVTINKQEPQPEL